VRLLNERPAIIDIETVQEYEQVPECTVLAERGEEDEPREYLEDVWIA
jgi:hypothetical protein